jgi:hypothetical protein
MSQRRQLGPRRVGFDATAPQRAKADDSNESFVQNKMRLAPHQANGATSQI